MKKNIMILKTKFNYIILLIMLLLQSSYAKEENLTILKNDILTVGILPQLGGHIVLLKYKDGKNILFTQEKLWNTKLDKISPENPEFLLLGGHITWLSPQKEWWTKQNFNIQNKNIKATWPPDPFLTLGECKILEKTDTNIKLEGNKSPVSSVALNLEIEIESNKVHIEAKIKNMTENEISWGLWSNTRLPNYARFYLPCQPEQIKTIRTEATFWHPVNSRLINFKFINGFLTFDIEDIFKHEGLEHVNKLYINTEFKTITAFVDEYLFIKTIHTNVTAVHPDQAPLEIYYNFSNSPFSFLELEAHSDYKVLKTNESISLKETWEIIPFKTNSSDPQVQTDCLSKIFR